MTGSFRTLAASLTIAGGLLLVGYSFGHASAAPQPRMQTALAHLRAARGSLERGVPDKSGHRLRALSLVNQSIEEVLLGIRDGK